MKKFAVLVSLIVLGLLTSTCLTFANGVSNAVEVVQADVAVVGGGGAGLVAALSAAEAGAKVVVLEKMGYLGGATMMSAGIIPAAGTRHQAEAGIEDSVDAFARDIFRPAHYSQRRELVYTVAENAKDIVEWMESLGVKWNLITTSLYVGQSNYRMHQAEGQGMGIVRVLANKVNEHPNIDVLLETPGVGLVTNTNDEVIGVIAKKKDGTNVTVIANAVILATSGFAANREMLAKYIPEALHAYPMMAPGATGEGIQWGLKLGADIANMKAYQGHAPFSVELHESLELAILYRGGILVTNEGDRFTNEYLGYSELAANVINQPDHYAYMIFDSENAKMTANFARYQAAGIVVEGNTAAELAEKLGMDPEKLQATFDDYEAGIKSGEDRFNRTKFPAEWKAPFYAIKVTGDLRHTQGGLVTDTQAHVLRTDGTAIPGLYAAGGVTEGFSSAGGPGYMSGNGLLQAFVFGRIAGQTAAAQAVSGANVD